MKPDTLSRWIAAIDKRTGGYTYNEIIGIYLEGFSDGYDKAKAELIEEIAKERFEGKKE